MLYLVFIWFWKRALSINIRSVNVKRKRIHSRIWDTHTHTQISEDMEYRKLKDQVPFFPSTSLISYIPINFVTLFFFQDEDGNGGGDDIESRKPLPVTNVPTFGGTTVDWSKWKLKYEFFSSSFFSFSFSNSNQTPCCN